MRAHDQAYETHDYHPQHTLGHILLVALHLLGLLDTTNVILSVAVKVRLAEVILGKGLLEVLLQLGNSLF